MRGVALVLPSAYLESLLSHGSGGGLVFIVEIAVTQPQYGFVIPRLFALRESTNVSAIMKMQG